MSDSERRLGIELLSVYGLDPPAHIALAAELGCGHISTGAIQGPFNPHGYPPWSLRDDPALRRATIAALRDHAVAVSLGEGFGVRPGVAMCDRERDVDLMAELGARCLNAVGMEPDTARADDEFATLAEMAAARGMRASVEFAPGLAVATMDDALALVARIGAPGLGLLVDAMHFFRSGGDTDRLAALDPAIVAHVQLCDAPRVAAHPDYMREASFERLPPGAGELPLPAFVAALPADVAIGLEVPMEAAALAGIGPLERLRPAVAAARLLLTRGEPSC